MNDLPPPKRIMSMRDPLCRDYFLQTLPSPVLPILNTWGAIVGTVGNRTLPGDKAFAIEAAYRFASAEEINYLHQWFISHHGYDPKQFPYSVASHGDCNPEAKEKGFCHPLFTAKDTCAGCAKSWLAGSYHQPSRCKPQAPSQWQKNCSDYIERQIKSAGGVSRVGPLVTIEYGGARRLEPTVKR